MFISLISQWLIYRLAAKQRRVIELIYIFCSTSFTISDVIHKRDGEGGMGNAASGIAAARMNQWRDSISDFHQTTRWQQFARRCGSPFVSFFAGMLQFFFGPFERQLDAGQLICIGGICRNLQESQDTVCNHLIKKNNK